MYDVECKAEPVYSKKDLFLPPVFLPLVLASLECFVIDFSVLCFALLSLSAKLASVFSRYLVLLTCLDLSRMALKINQVFEAQR